MIALTKENYFSPENTAISSSKVRDFLRSKELYYKRHISHELQPEETPSLLLGRLVDACIERGSFDWFKETYSVAVLKRDNAELFEYQKANPEFVISADTYARVIGMCDKIFRSPFFEFYNPIVNPGIKVYQQIPLWTAIDAYNICGMIDMLTIKNEDGKRVAYIDDLKTTNASSLRSAKHWAWHALDYGYHRQMACYRLLVQSAYPEVDEIVCRHFVIGTSKADNYPIQLYKFTDAMLDRGEKEFITVAHQISIEQEFIDKLPSWDDAVEIPNLVEEEEDLTEVSDDEMENL